MFCNTFSNIMRERATFLDGSTDYSRESRTLSYNKNQLKEKSGFNETLCNCIELYHARSKQRIHEEKHLHR